MDNAFKYIISNNGIDTEVSYPYTARDGSCKFSSSNFGATFLDTKMFNQNQNLLFKLLFNQLDQSLLLLMLLTLLSNFTLVVSTTNLLVLLLN